MLKFGIAYLWNILCATFGKKKNGLVRSGYRYDVIRGTEASDRLFKGIVFSATGLAAIDWNGDIVHDLGQQMTTCDL